MRLFSCIIVLCLCWANASHAHTERKPQFLDQTIKLKSTHRIVSLAPVITETLFALGAGNSLVGVTRFCDRPKAAQEITKVGGFIDGNLEKIVSLKPDLVIAMPQNSQKKLFEQLQSHGIPVYLVFGDRIGEVKEMIHALGQLLQRETRAIQLLKDFETDYAQLKNTIAQADDTIVALASTQPIIVAGSNTFIHESLQHLGLQPRPKKTSVLWPTWSLNPD